MQCRALKKLRNIRGIKMGNNKPQYVQFELHPIYLKEVQNQLSYNQKLWIAKTSKAVYP
jgi:hypothetical protein